MEQLPAELVQVLGLVFGTVAFTGLLKSIAGKLDATLKGYGAVAVSFAAALVLSALAVVAGWYPVELPEFTGNPVEYLGSWLTVAGGVTAMANLLYVYVYEKIKPNTPARGSIG